MKNVFIIGAGASVQAGGPTMANFLDRAQDVSRLNADSLKSASQDFERVFEALSELQGIHAKSYLDLDNIEILFGAIEMGLLLKKLGERSEEEIRELRNSLITAIYKTLEYSIEFPVAGDSILLPGPYYDFFSMLEEEKVLAPREDPHSYSFITFNYDVCLDVGLSRFPSSFDYCLNGEKQSNAIPLLKLHGSINWGEKGGQIIPVDVKRLPFGPFYDLGPYVYYNVGSFLTENEYNGDRLSGPVIVPPTWNKNSYHGQLSNVWSVAAQELSQAENIIVIGYSLPETDSFFRYLYSLGSKSDIRLRNFIVINPDNTRACRDRFSDLIGRGISDRFQYITCTFEEGIGSIRQLLQSP